MKIFINNEIAEIQPNSTLKELVDRFKLQQEKGYAVAINEVVITKTEWFKTTLKENDNVLLFEAIQGG